MTIPEQKLLILIWHDPESAHAMRDKKVIRMHKLMEVTGAEQRVLTESEGRIFDQLMSEVRQIDECFEFVRRKREHDEYKSGIELRRQQQEAAVRRTTVVAEPDSPFQFTCSLRPSAPPWLWSWGTSYRPFSDMPVIDYLAWGPKRRRHDGAP